MACPPTMLSPVQSAMVSPLGLMNVSPSCMANQTSAPVASMVAMLVGSAPIVSYSLMYQLPSPSAFLMSAWSTGSVAGSGVGGLYGPHSKGPISHASRSSYFH